MPYLFADAEGTTVGVAVTSGITGSVLAFLGVALRDWLKQRARDREADRLHDAEEDHTSYDRMKELVDRAIKAEDECRRRLDTQGGTLQRVIARFAAAVTWIESVEASLDSHDIAYRKFRDPFPDGGPEPALPPVGVAQEPRK